jgi:hypothetical protein
VYADGRLIGRTPLSLPRPAEGQTLEIVLKADGYKDLALRITPYTQETLALELDKEKERRRGGSGASPGRPEPSTPARPEPDNNRKPRPPTEVLDPWG